MALTETQVNKLAKLQNCGTKYEAVVIRADGESRLLGYLGRHSAQGLASALDNSARQIAAFLGADETTRVWKEKGAVFAFSCGGRVMFSGRTQREAIQGGELVSINTCKKEA